MNERRTISLFRFMVLDIIDGPCNEEHANSAVLRLPDCVRKLWRYVRYCGGHYLLLSTLIVPNP